MSHFDSLKERLLSKIRIDAETGCWHWTAALNYKGYGVISTQVNGKKRNRYAHQVSYEQFKGPIATGLTIDHTCHNPATCVCGDGCLHRRCINPEHLEAVTTQVNSSRGKHAKATHCPQGHPYAGDNLILYRSGSRACRACARRTGLHRTRKWVANHREAYLRRRRELRATESARAKRKAYRQNHREVTNHRARERYHQDLEASRFKLREKRRKRGLSNG